MDILHGRFPSHQSWEIEESFSCQDYPWEILYLQNSVGAFWSCGEILHRFGGGRGQQLGLDVCHEWLRSSFQRLGMFRMYLQIRSVRPKNRQNAVDLRQNSHITTMWTKMWFQNDLGINYVTWYCMRIRCFFWSLCSSCFRCFSITAVPIFLGLVAALAQSTSGSNWRAEPSILSLGCPSDGNEQKFGLLVSWQGNPGLEIYIYLMICDISKIKYLNVTITTIILESKWEDDVS